MEYIVLGLTGLLSRLATNSTSLIGSVEEILARQLSRLAGRAQDAIGVILWCIPIIFWTVMIRFVVKHW